MVFFWRLLNRMESHVRFHLGHIAWRPPSMGRLTPVMKLAASEARKAMLCATSSTSPGRPRACVCWHLSRNWWWRRWTEWAFNTFVAVTSAAAAWLRCFSATGLCFDHCCLITWQKVLSNRLMNKWITSMWFISNRHGHDTLPVCTAAHLVLLFCGHLWRWRQGWQGEANGRKAGYIPDIHFQIGCQHTPAMPLTTQSSPSLAYLPVLKWINLF